jgi:hypothetical protein
VFDFEIAHSLEGDSGVLVMIVATAEADAFQGGLLDLGYSTSRTDLA